MFFIGFHIGFPYVFGCFFKNCFLNCLPKNNFLTVFPHYRAGGPKESDEQGNNDLLHFFSLRFSQNSGLDPTIEYFQPKNHITRQNVHISHVYRSP